MSEYPMRLPITFSHKRNSFEEKLINFSNEIFNNVIIGILYMLLNNIIFIYFSNYKREYFYQYICSYFIFNIFNIIIFQTFCCK